MPRPGKAKAAKRKAKEADPPTEAAKVETGFRGKPDGLTAKQWAFCLEYIVDFNGTQAAIRAGYSAESAAAIAYENLRKPAIAEEIANLVTERTGASRTTVLNELAAIAFADIRDVVSWRPEIVQEEVDGGEGEPVAAYLSRVLVRPSHDLDRQAAAAVKSVSQGANGILKVEMHDKPAALDKIARILGMFQESGPVNVDLNPTIIIDGRPDGRADAKPAPKAMGRVRNAGH